uniref:Uncharacterized protein n=1 Tax=Arundo donax TaxID=35708 RepID=A0A0A8ZX12_ARUDO
MYISFFLGYTCNDSALSLCITTTNWTLDYSTQRSTHLVSWPQ